MENKGYVLITGAGSGLGKSLAIQFAKRNYPVVLVGRTKEKLDAVSSEYGQNISLCISADVSKHSEVEKIFKQANDWGKFPSIVISCAGEGVFGQVGTFDDEQISRVLSANLIGTILVAQKGFLEMKENGGTIVNVMSTAATVGRANESIYCASKWGAKGFTESLRLETKGTKVKVVSVYPGGMQTPFWNEKAGATPDTSSFMKPDEVAQTIIENLLDKQSLYVADIILNRN